MGWLWGQWQRFWFTPTQTLRLSVWRVLLGLLMLWMNSIRAFSFREFYTDQGMVLHDQAPLMMPEFYRAPFFLGNNTITGPLFVAFIVITVLLIVGIGGRLTSFLLLMVHLSFLQRNFSVAYGVDLVVACWLFYLTIGESCRYLTVKHWWRKKSPWEPINGQRLGHFSSTVALRLMQIQLCAIYGYTGLEKLKGEPWWEGSAIWSVLGNKQFMLFDFSSLQYFPSLVAALTFLSLVFEIYFPVLVWIKPLRRYVLLFAVLFHAGISGTMGLLAFGLVMNLGLLSFLQDEELRALIVRVKKSCAFAKMNLRKS